MTVNRTKIDNIDCFRPDNIQYYWKLNVFPSLLVLKKLKKLRRIVEYLRFLRVFEDF